MEINELVAEDLELLVADEEEYGVEDAASVVVPNIDAQAQYPDPTA